MKQRAYFTAHGGGGGGSGSRLPKFAEDIAAILFRNTSDNFGGGLGPQGAGIFGDIQQGYNDGPAGTLFGGGSFGGGGAGGSWGDSVRMGQAGRDYFGGNSVNLADRGVQAGMQLNDRANAGAQHSANYNDLNGAFLDQSSRGYNTLMGLLNNAPGLDGRNDPRAPNLANRYGVGTVGAEAMKAAQNVGPDSELYKSTLSFLTPQVRTAFAARGMGDSGQAVGAEGDQARQLADSFATRAQQEKNAFLQTAAGSEGTAAGFQGARNNALANIFGSQAGLEGGRNSALANIFGSQVQGALGATEAPSRVFSTMQGGLGQGIQNIGAALGQYLQPQQMNQAGLAGLGQALNLPVAYQQQLYNFLRSPQTQLMGVPSSTGQQGLGSHPNGLLGDILGFEKGG